MGGEPLQETDPVAVRREKLETLEERGVDPFPATWPVTHTAAEVLEAFGDEEPELDVRIAGRVVSVRGHGRTTFLHVADRTGRIQAYLRQDDLGEGVYSLLELLDLGDYLGVGGRVMRTRTGEVTVQATEVAVLAKALRPLPIGKRVETGEGARTWHQSEDPEFRYRQRYADLAVRPEARAVFESRAEILRYLRDFLDARGFLEVETPALQPVYGGATARPFTTYHHALDTTLYLRIADELYLKRCVVGGLERVYEIAKDFRNEGLSRFHNPEFTMLEFYAAYMDYRDLMELTEELLVGLVERAAGGTELTWQGTTVDVAPPWPRVSFLAALAERGVAVEDLSRRALAAEAGRFGVEIEPADGAGRILDRLFSELVEPGLDDPVFVLDHPRELSPLAKRHPDDPRLVERFEAYLFGKELGNAFTELNDPREQRERFEAQAALAAAGDVEAAAAIDEDFLRALEYGMPPTAGMGIGVDRLVMFLTDQPSIRDVILFPVMRPEERERVDAGDLPATPAGTAPPEGPAG
ncbi:MAG: lysine--tRNA ligase [Gemmatimonadetes bacterium]|nr:lysine--tRNA ligase [Gemmatimonadota bacterium]